MADLKLGLQLGYWGSTPPTGFVELAQQAERLGFDSVWTAEAYGSDAVSPAALRLRIRLMNEFRGIPILLESFAEL